MWEPGAVVLEGRFRVGRALAGRGPGEVYAAEEVSGSRPVTLKLFPPLNLGPHFEEEGRRLATVSHPSVVRVLEALRAQGAAYLVTEPADGPLLSDELKGEPLLPDRALELLTQLAEGLAALHEKGLLHGDLRPAKVVLVKGEAGERARLIDFGLTRLLEPEFPDAAATVVGQVVGPIDHLAPAQAGGARPDVPGDLFALGALAYHLLSGILPARPSPKPLAQVAPHLADQPALCDWVMQCLDAEPARRPKSAAEAAKTLAALPRPADPTIFLETMQRPPPVPAAKPAPVAPPPLPPPAVPSAPFAASPEGPRPLLASVETLVVPKETAAAQLGTAPMPAAVNAPRRPWIAGAVAAALAGVAGVLLFTSGSTAREARQLIEHRQPMQALEIIGKAQRKLSVPDPALSALRVAALHLSEGHTEEIATFKSLAPASSEAVDPLVLSGLVEDFAKREDPVLRTLLRTLPKQRLQSVLEDLARAPISARQWGALRYLDLEEGAARLNLVALYSASLESSDCAVRRSAAKRLGQLMDDAAEGALNRLRDAPREGAERSCGQDEAQAALQALRKGR